MPPTSPSVIRSFALERVAGYNRVEWPSLHPEFNLLVGPNGVGKSTLLEALVIALNYLDGEHKRDAVSRQYEDATFEIALASDSSPRRFSTRDVRSLQGEHDTGWTCHILQIVENRQPKNQFGKMGSPQETNPLMRYAACMARLQRMFKSKEDEDVLMAETLRQHCRTLSDVASPAEWDWIFGTIRERGPRTLRPVSCGQYDVLALLLDLFSFVRDTAQVPAPRFVIFDNPETYLHPAALWPVLHIFRETLPDAQFFITSHSLKVLVYPEQKSVFLFPRAPRTDAVVSIQNTHYLPQRRREAFFALYGDDVRKSVFDILGEFESPAVHQFLMGCVHECYAKQRGQDYQVRFASASLTADHQVILDFGAGHGDLLLALIDAPAASAAPTYIAFDQRRQTELDRRVKVAKAAGNIAQSSRVLDRLEDLTGVCDVVVLMNVCHHLEIPTLARRIHGFLATAVRRVPGCGLLIAELRTLAEGEREFLLWSPEEYGHLFAPWPQLRVEARRWNGSYPAEGFDATLVQWAGDDRQFVAPGPVELEERLWGMLPAKRATAVTELEALRSNAQAEGLAEYWRQKRVGFLCAQLAWIAVAEHRREGAAAANS